MKDENKRSYLSLLALAGNISMSFAVNLVVGLLLGQALDDWLSIRPWGTAAGALCGFAAAMWSVFKLVMKGKMSNR